MAAASPPRESGEDRLIAKYFKPLARHPGAFGLADDAAAIAPPPGCDVVLKADAIVGGVHFFPDDPADTVAQKALRVNLSDLAAKGATPLGFLLSLALPKEIGEPWIAAFARGLGADAGHYACPLMGGDTDRTTGPAVISIAAVGAVPHGKMVLRSGAKAGHCIAVTGTIGDAALGLALRRDKTTAAHLEHAPRLRDHLAGRYLLPEPRTVLAEALRMHVSAAMDVSDGLVGDLAKLCRASGVAAEVDAALVPLSDAARAAFAADPELRETILTGGDDYEILCTLAPDRFDSFRAAAEAVGVPVTEIGTIMAGEGARFLGPDGELLTFARASFSHF